MDDLDTLNADSEYRGSSEGIALRDPIKKFVKTANENAAPKGGAIGLVTNDCRSTQQSELLLDRLEVGLQCGNLLVLFLQALVKRLDGRKVYAVCVDIVYKPIATADIECGMEILSHRPWGKQGQTTVSQVAVAFGIDVPTWTGTAWIQKNAPKDWGVIQGGDFGGVRGGASSTTDMTTNLLFSSPDRLPHCH